MSPAGPVDLAALEGLAKELEQAMLEKVERLAKVAELSGDWSVVGRSGVHSMGAGGFLVSVDVEVVFT